MKRLLILAVFAAACSQADGSSLPEKSAVPQQGRMTPADSAAAEALLAKADAGRIQGDPSQKLYIVEVSDFQCPYCKMFHDSTYATIKKEFIATGQARMAYVSYPISSHINAVPSAEAAMCVSAQGKFWAMHDALFDSQEKWALLENPAPYLESLAKKVGADIPSYRSCVASGTMKRLVTADRLRGTNAGVNSTPYFFIGDEVVRGAAPAQAFRDAMKKAMAKARPGKNQ